MTTITKTNGLPIWMHQENRGVYPRRRFQNAPPPLARLYWYCTVLLGVCLLACSNPKYTANDIVPHLTGPFDFGTNMGYFPPHYGDRALAELAHQFGVTSIRPGLFHHFLETWGYDARIEHFRFYDSLGLRNIVAIIGFPAESARDTAHYCPEHNSELFRGLYEPIWDDGQNGTPVNDANLFALYVWKTATTYKSLVKIYEVWNEPDYDTGYGWLMPGQPGNWWKNPAHPCDTRLKAPVFHYIRTLRISYEVIKRIDPDALVAVGGLGWPSYLDMICRYTDEPTKGKRLPEYPHTGGAYFDCMSFHAYPHLGESMREKDDSLNIIHFNRHSDAAMDGLWQLKNSFRAVLHKYGYDNVVFPEKHWICTEFNIPRKAFGEFIGSEEAQINFLLKTLVAAPQQGLEQMHLYSIADEMPEGQGDTEFAYMGLFQNLEQVLPQQARPNAIAWALKTLSTELEGFRYDSARTAAMNLPATVRGAAFWHRQRAAYVYVLWAKTYRDQDEDASSGYAFPPEWGMGQLVAKPWHHSRTGAFEHVQANQIRLSGSPVILVLP